MSMMHPDGQYPNQLLGVEGVQDTNAGALNVLAVPTRVGGTAVTNCVISSGTGAPATGGNIGDLYIRTDGGETTYFYRCTTAGVAGAAVWTAMSGA